MSITKQFFCLAFVLASCLAHALPSPESGVALETQHFEAIDNDDKPKSGVALETQTSHRHSNTNNGHYCGRIFSKSWETLLRQHPECISYVCRMILQDDRPSITDYGCCRYNNNVSHWCNSNRHSGTSIIIPSKSK